MHNAITYGLALVVLAISPGAALAQSDVEPSADPLASPIVETPAPSAAPAAEGVSLRFDEPRWKRVATSRGPAGREDHTWTVDAGGRYAYLFGGRDGGKSFDDLWRFDLQTDTWKKLAPRGKTPSARFGHSAVWADGRGLVVFAGQRGADFFGDLWAYDPEKDRWTLLPARGDAPKRRYGTCMIVAPDGRLQISHGFTFTGRFDDTRAYNLKTERWASIGPDGRRPGERCLHDCFTSSSGQMVLYGGQDNSVRALGDLWVMRANNTWKQEADPKAKPRRLYAVTEAGDYAYIFGGAGKDDRVFDDLWRVDRETLKFKRVNVPGPSPSARFAGTLITDAKGGRVLLFGGKDNVAKADLWELTDASATGDPDESGASPAPISGDESTTADESA